MNCFSLGTSYIDASVSPYLIMYYEMVIFSYDTWLSYKYYMYNVHINFIQIVKASTQSKFKRIVKELEAGFIFRGPARLLKCKWQELNLWWNSFCHVIKFRQGEICRETVSQPPLGCRISPCKVSQPYRLPYRMPKMYKLYNVRLCTLYVRLFSMYQL